MSIHSGQIIKNLISTESVVINKIQALGTMVSITFTGINSSRQNSKVISVAEFEKLEVLTQEGNFNFNGVNLNRYKVLGFSEAELKKFANEFSNGAVTTEATYWGRKVKSFNSFLKAIN